MRSKFKYTFILSVLVLSFFTASHLLRNTTYLSIFKTKNSKASIETVAPEEDHSLVYAEYLDGEIEGDKIDQVATLFQINQKILPLTQTIRYKPKVSWVEGRSAWLVDYANHFQTSRHFIARSLNRKIDYETQKVMDGDVFNVLKEHVTFQLVIDLSRCKMRFYGMDEETSTQYLLKTYPIGVGRFVDDSHGSLLTPKGIFMLGSRTAVYKPNMEGIFQNEKAEMMCIFGTRWLPFAASDGEETADWRGYGIHGAPWIYDSDTQTYTEDLSTIGMYKSDGCIHMQQEDIEELFAIVVTKPTSVEIVENFRDATLIYDKAAR